MIHCFKWFLYFHSEPVNRFGAFTLTRLLEKQVQSRHRQYFAVQSNFDLVVSRHDLHSITHSKAGQSDIKSLRACALGDSISTLPRFFVGYFIRYYKPPARQSVSETTKSTRDVVARHLLLVQW